MSDQPTKAPSLSSKEHLAMTLFKSNRSLTLREVRSCVGLTDREGDRLLQRLKRLGLIVFSKRTRLWRAA